MKILILKREPKESESFGSHDTAILKALKHYGGEAPREKVVAFVEKQLEGKTVQPASRIVSYQTPLLVEKGLVKVREEKGEEKPAKVSKKAKAKTKKPKAKAKAVHAEEKVDDIVEKQTDTVDAV